MISLIILAVNSVISACVYLIKAVFSLIRLVVKTVMSVFKLAFALLPMTLILSILSIFLLVLISLNGSAPDALAGFSLLRKAADLSVGQLFFYFFLIDIGLYLIRALFGQTFVAQAMGRYYRLFPEAGKRHEERQYDKLLRQRNKELERDIRERRRSRSAGFYEDADEDYPGNGRFYRGEDYSEDDEFYEDEDDDYPEGDDFPEDDEFYGDEDDDYPEDDDFYGDDSEGDDFYGDDDSEDDEFYEDEEDEEFYEDFEDDYDDPRSHRRGRHDRTESESSSSRTFDFFAGCSSRESVDKKYKSLVKLYHPDNMDGDTAALQEINAQYAEAKKRFG